MQAPLGLSAAFALGTLAASAFLLALALKFGKASWLPDHANHRSLHTGVIPRFGGIAIMVALFLSLLAAHLYGARASHALPSLWWGPIVLIFALALWDDWKALPWYWRFPIQSIATIWFLLLLPGPVAWPSVVLAALAMQWATNLFNFMDGMDGLAGTMGVIGFSALWLLGGGQQLDIALLVAASCLGFLLFNRFPAKVFMGDSGSTTLGMLAAAIGVAGVHNGTWHWPIPVLIFLPFVYDASSTLMLRMLAKKRIWEAHREHMYQRAVLAGYKVPIVWAAAAIQMAVCSGAALAVQKRPLHVQLFVLAIFTVLYAVLQLWLSSSRKPPTP
jgi:UDP-GlcNAc:undecaprenyl-phosphate/decaprenyl-phosphate GlcNAc-1-phosphate transferase